MKVSGRARTGLQDQFGDLLIDLASLLHLPGDLVHRVDHGRMVPLAEDPADGRIAVVRELPGQVHGDLACRDQRPGAARPTDRLDGEAVAGSRGVENYLRRNPTRLSGLDQVGEDLFGLSERNG